jgi:hypothetical protein
MPEPHRDIEVVFVEEDTDTFLPLPAQTQRTYWPLSAIPQPGDTIRWPDPEGPRELLVVRRKFEFRHGGDIVATVVLTQPQKAS